MSKEKIWHLFSRKLSGEASQEELAELLNYFDEHPNAQHEMNMLEQLWNHNDEADRDYLEATYHLHIEKMKKLGVEPRFTEDVADEPEKLSSSFLLRNRWMLAAASSIFIIATTAFFLFQNSKQQAVEIASASTETKHVVATKNGTNTSFKLPDGSTVWMNAGSKLDYSKINESVGTREVYLTGEAFFDVVKNPKRPFIIHTSSIDVKVLGTKFNVKAYPEDKTVETSLVQGSVEVFVKNRPGERYLLKPNQKLVLLNEPELAATNKANIGRDMNMPIIAIKRLTYVKNDTLAVETSWTRNKLVFENESFGEIAKKMERWYDVAIEFNNHELEVEQLNGDFSKETLKQALNALRFTTNFNYKIEGKTVTIY